MKKLAILTSILALAACGGGSGGGHGGSGNVPGEVVKPSEPLTAEQRAAAIASNEKITDMNSFVIVGGDNPTVLSNVRSGGIKLSDGGTMYTLDDVNFETASMVQNTGGDRGTIKFHTKDGIIDTISINNEVLDMAVGRQGDTNKFDGTFDFIDEETGELAKDIPVAVRYSSAAKDKGVGLKYSDFGVIAWGDTHEMYDTDNYFAGGYKVKEIDTTKISNETTFSGKADGLVRVGDMGDSMDEEDWKGFGELAVSTDAKLTFKNGESTLNANFDNWYDVTAKMDNNGQLTELKFANGNKENFAQGADFKANEGAENPNYDFKWHGNDEHTAVETHSQGDWTFVRDGFVKYYGDDNNPAEATGVIRYADPSAGTDAEGHNDNMRFDMGFGVKRD